MQSNKYTHFINGAYNLHEEHIEDAAKILTVGFTRKNVVWSQANMQMLQMKQFLMGTIRKHLEAQKASCKATGQARRYNQFLIEDGHMSAVTLHFDFYEYISMPLEDKPSNIQLFNILEKYGGQLLKKIDTTIYDNSRTLYINFGAHVTNGRKHKISPPIRFAQVLILAKQQGYRYIVGRVSSEQARRIYEILGGRMVEKIIFQIENGKNASLSFIELDMNNPTFLSFEAKARQLTALEHNQPLAKL